MHHQPTGCPAPAGPPRQSRLCSPDSNSTWQDSQRPHTPPPNTQLLLTSTSLQQQTLRGQLCCPPPQFFCFILPATVPLHFFPTHNFSPSDMGAGGRAAELPIAEGGLTEGGAGWDPSVHYLHSRGVEGAGSPPPAELRLQGGRGLGWRRRRIRRQLPSDPSRCQRGGPHLPPTRAVDPGPAGAP